MTTFRHIRAVAFDVGGTLMYEDSIQTRSLRPMPMAAYALETLAPYATLVVASNVNYTAEHTAALLERMRLRQFFSHIYTSQTTTAMKPQAAYFEYILRDLNLQPDQVVMVGDTYYADISGAKRAGLWTIWLTGSTTEAEDADVVISGLRGAPPAVAWIDEQAANAAEARNRPALP